MTETTSTSGALPVTAVSGGPVAGVAADASLLEVADALAAAGVGALVIGSGDRPAGIVSERDLVAALAARRDPAATTAADIAHTTLVWCDATATVAEVAELMMERYIRHALVEDDGRLVGIVSARDLLGIYAAGDVGSDADED
jgi:CBS domain-containing protein